MYRDWVNLILKSEYLLPEIRLKDRSTTLLGLTYLLVTSNVKNIMRAQ